MRAPRTVIAGVVLPVIAALVAALAPAASAGTARLKDGVGPSQGPIQTLVYQAARGERNVVNVSYGSGAFTLSDRAGVTPGPGCLAESLTRVGCPLTGGKGVGGIVASLGDGDDYAIASGTSAVLGGGTGNDSLFGSGHEDELAGGPGRDLLEGGVGQDTINGGGGNDRIRGRDSFPDVVSCGSGRDRATLDGLDYYADRCERVRRSDRAGATVVDLTSSRARGGTAIALVGCPRDAVGPCRGSVTLREHGHSLGKARFRVRRAHLGSARIRLPEDIVRRLEETGIGVNVVLRADVGRVHRTVTVPQLLPGL
jgi:hypothetical protein